MTEIAETQAAWLAQNAVLGGGGIRGALDLTFRDIDLEDVAEWSAFGCEQTLRVASDAEAFRARFAGAIAAALVMGAKLAQTGSR